MGNTIMLQDLLRVVKEKLPLYEEELYSLNDNITDSDPDSEWARLHDLRVNIVPALKNSIERLERLIDEINYLEEEGCIPQP